MMQLLKQTIEEWRSDEVGVHAAALAYYAIFSLAPMLIIVIAVLTFFGRGDAQVTILEQIRSVAGQDAAQLVRSMIESRQAAGGNTLATVVGLGLVLVGATGVVAQLQNALNIIWQAKPEPERSGLRHMLRVRIMSLLLIIGVGLLLVAVRLGTAILRSLVAVVREEVPQIGLIWTVLDPLILIVVSGLVFSVVFKYLPDVRIAWRPVVVGGLVTAVGFAMGNWLLSLYLSWGAVASVYGAAGALVAILLWVFLSSHILLLGAEFTKVYARRTGDRIVPDAHAVPRHN
jgi:membrane protein